MKLGHDLDEIRYIGDTGQASIYRVTLEGRPVMDIVVDISTGAISISKPGADEVNHPLIPTKGVATMDLASTEDSNGGLLDVQVRVDYRSVYGYVLPRLHILIARLYVPLA